MVPVLLQHAISSCDAFPHTAGGGWLSPAGGYQPAVDGDGVGRGRPPATHRGRGQCHRRHAARRRQPRRSLRAALTGAFLLVTPAEKTSESFWVRRLFRYFALISRSARKNSGQIADTSASRDAFDNFVQYCPSNAPDCSLDSGV